MVEKQIHQRSLSTENNGVFPLEQLHMNIFNDI